MITLVQKDGARSMLALAGIVDTLDIIRKLAGSGLPRRGTPRSLTIFLFSISLRGTNASHLQLLPVAGPTLANAFASILQASLGSCLDHTSLASNLDDPSRSCPDVFRHIPNCKSLATVST